jgi:recombination protein RecT
MTGTDLVQRTQQTVALIDHPQFLEQVEALLPDTLPLRRFVQVAKTAIRTNPDLVAADQTSLFGSIVRCPQYGLNPDGHEAALVPYKGKVSYLPMIVGLRKRLADYGWTLKTRVVYSNDEFEYSEEPQHIRHVPVRPGGDRGDRIAAYAVATHRDGRRLQIILDSDEIAKRRAKAQTQAVWNEWPDAMWEKSAGHAIESEIPKAERDRMALPEDDLEPAQAAELLYGPDGTSFAAREISAAPTDSAEPSAIPPDEGPDAGEETRQAEPTAPSPAAGPAPGGDEDPEPEPAWAAAGTAEVPAGQWKGKTLADVAGDASGREWLAWALRNQGRFNEPFYTALTTYVEGALPELWANHTGQQAA